MNAIERISVTDQVVKEIRNLITSGEFTAGDKLPTEKELCTKLKVSRSTIREAFRVLQAMDFVEIRSGKGSFVKNISPNSPELVKSWFIKNAPKLNDFIEVRLAIESLAIKVAIQHSEKKDIDELEQIEKKFEEAVANSSIIDMASFDEAFHNKIVAMTKNSLLIHLNSVVADEFRKYRSKAFSVKANAKHPIKPHRKICKAFRKHDEGMGVACIEMHLKQSKQDISKVMTSGTSI